MDNPLKKLEEKIDNKAFTLGVIGMGYVGLPLSLTFLRKKIHVMGFDIDGNKVAMLNRGESYIAHIPSAELAQLRDEKLFEATSDFTRLGEPDVLLICVPTPLTKQREPDLQYIETTGKAIAATLRAGQMIVLESTTYPGTTVEILKPVLEKHGLIAGKDFALAFSPEREDPGNINYCTASIPKVVGGVDPLCSRLAQKFYETGINKVVKVSSTQAAELTKLLENIFRSVNIALVNELKILCNLMGIDVWEVIDAASTKPFGFMPFYPGPGLGGHCIPIDPFYLTYKAREFDFPTKFIELAGEVNMSMPYYVINMTMEALNRARKSLNGAKVLVLGIAYKKNVNDDRESPSYKLIELLYRKGAIVAYNDPHLPALKPRRHLSFDLKSTPLTEKNLSEFDCVLLSTDHSAYDYDFILKHSKLIVDTRNAFAGKAGAEEKVVKA